MRRNSISRARWTTAILWLSLSAATLLKGAAPLASDRMGWPAANAVVWHFVSGL